MSAKSPITVFAPATVANVASGFDILGFAIDAVGDRVSVSRTSDPGVTIAQMTGTMDGVSEIPKDAQKNTAGLPILKMIEAFKPPFGIQVSIVKGIPLGSGMGGSAASAVGAVVAVHALFLREGVIKKALPLDELLHFALLGEALASGSMHADNIAPCLYGGFTLSFPGESPRVTKLTYPSALYSVVVHPELRIETKTARSILKKELTLKSHVEQSARLASLVLGCASENLELIARGLEDVLIEPQRAALIPGFYEVKAAALEAEALGASISGAGPAVFALAGTREIAEMAKTKMMEAFSKHANLKSQGFVSPIRKSGASVQ